jgi:putative RNA 2'-phosphotransferase
MERKRLVKVSRYLSRHLRHQPERLGISLQAGGWVEVDELLAACAAHSFAVSREELQEAVERNDKRRFSFDASGTRIRANQGHSVEIDLGLEPTEPPAVLFHGTAQARLDAILGEGLHKMGRHHVHLSADAETATRVGARSGKPVVLEVAAARMAADDHDFFVTANGVWLTDAVPPDFLTPL